MILMVLYFVRTKYRLLGGRINSSLFPLATICLTIVPEALYTLISSPSLMFSIISLLSVAYTVSLSFELKVVEMEDDVLSLSKAIFKTELWVIIGVVIVMLSFAVDVFKTSSLKVTECIIQPSEGRMSNV